MLETQAKKSNAEYKRCFEIPASHTGLTGTFSTIQLGNFMASTQGTGLDETRLPKRSSPIDVTKTLFCELEEPAEDVFEEESKNISQLSFTSPLAQSLNLDSDGSVHETSLTIDSKASFKLNKCPDIKQSPEPQQDVRDSMMESLSQTPSAGNAAKLGFSAHRVGPPCPFLSPLPDFIHAAQSPSDPKPRNVVVFRSYCSSINRSNMSGVSRLSIGSVDAMDTSSASALHHSLCHSVTPVQKRVKSSSSACQVLTTKHSGSNIKKIEKLLEVSLITVINSNKSLIKKTQSAHIEFLDVYI